MADASVDRRTLLGGALAGIGIAAVPARARAAAADVTVSPQGPVRTLGAALALAAEAGGRPFTIRLMPGVYEEKLRIATPRLTIVGSGPASVLSFGAAAGHTKPDGGKWGTTGSASLTIEAPDVTLRDLTVRNSFDYVDDRRTGASGGAQAVALAVGRGADRTRVVDCAIEGYQDTLLVQSRALFDACRISGTTDFIFGGGNALFRRCRIVTRHVPGAASGGYLAAPSTPGTQPFGLVFRRCRLEREGGVPDDSTWLGRPWRAGGNMSLVGAAAFLDCWMDAHIRGAGWTSMGYRDPAGVSRQFQPAEARLFEHRSRGPGAGPAGEGRRMWTDAEARAVTDAAVLGGWRV